MKKYFVILALGLLAFSTAYAATNVLVNPVQVGKNGASGTAASITLCDGANPGASETLTYAKWNGLNDTNGLVKCNGSGTFSAASAGTDYQAASSKLADIAALAATDNNIIVGNGTTWVAESGATARTSLGLGNVENTALSTWAGTASVTTLGTVTTGAWNAGAVTSSGAITSNSIKTIAVSPATSDGSDTSGLDLAGGGAAGRTRGASIGLTGNEYSAAGFKGIAIYRGGNTYTSGNDGAHVFQVGDAVEAFKISYDQSVWAVGNISALSFTDRTPGYSDDALAELKAIKNDAHGDIDHSTLPTIAKKKIKVTEQKPVLDEQGKPRVDASGMAITTPVEKEEDGRDLGAMISFLTAVCQKQQEQIEDLVKRVEKLEIELQIKPKFPVND